MTFLASSAEQASAQAPVGPGQAGGMPGGMLTLSADGQTPYRGRLGHHPLP